MIGPAARRITIFILVLACVLLVTQLTLPPEHTFDWKNAAAGLHFKSQITSFIFPPQADCPTTNSEPLPIDHYRQICKTVPSALPDFSLQVCYENAVCNAFTLRIRRTSEAQCREEEDGPDPSANATLSDWIRRERGPDAFLVRTDGAERVGTTWSTYEGECAYRFDIRLRNPGPVYLQAWQTFEKYEAFSETNHTWPEMLFHPLTSVPFELDLCPSECRTVTAQPTIVDDNATFYRITSPSASLSTFRTLDDDQTLPACDGPEPIQGSYLPAHWLDVLYPPYRLPQVDMIPVGGRYKYFPQGCQWKHDGTLLGDLKKCTQNRKRIQVLGDSHGRTIYDAMVNRLRGIHEPLKQSLKNVIKSDTINDMRFSFLWDPRGKMMLEEFTKVNCTELFHDVDAFVLSTGAHYAVDDTTDHYLHQLSMMLNLPLPGGLCHSSTPLPKLIFVTGPAQPPRQDNYVREFKDHRTNVRMAYWAQEATRMALEAGWAVVDQYALTMPHLIAPMRTDKAHFLMTDAMDPILDEVIGKAGLCNDLDGTQRVVVDELRA